MEENMVIEQISTAIAYAQMEELPGKIEQVVSVYNSNIKHEEKRHSEAIRSIESTFSSDKQRIRQQKETVIAQAGAAKKVIMDQLAELREQLNREKSTYDNLVYGLPGKGEYDKSLGSGLFKVLTMVRQTKENAVAEFERLYQGVADQESNIYDEKVRAAVETHDTQFKSASETYYASVDRENQKYASNQAFILNTAKKTIESWGLDQIKENYRTLLLNAPVYTNFENAELIPESIEIGALRVDLDFWKKDSTNRPVIDLLTDFFGYALKNENGRSSLVFPYGQSFKDERFNKIITHNAYDRNNALDYLRALEMRLFMCVPGGKLRVCMMDPVDSGSNFSRFAELGDEDERIISTRIWYESKRIKERLTLLIDQIAHVHQDCLRGEFDDIVDYNIAVGKNAEPLQALFIADFPKNFDQEAIELLEKVVSSGAQCGIYTFICASKEEMSNCKYDLRSVFSGAQVITCDRNSFTYQYGTMAHNLNVIEMPEKEEQVEIFATLTKAISESESITITFDEVTEGLTKHKEKWFKFDDKNGIDIPIGLEGARRTVKIHLGGELITQHHALISGTIGSGKSTLLHTIIMSTLLHYSPEDVQIYLLDFKRGVEFKIYADSQLPNFRVISLDTEPEFGLAVLHYLEEEQETRAQEFHDKGVDNIERYNEIAEADPYDDIYKLPRIFVIIDEFHEMFSNKDENITKECETLLEQIVRQGRAMGIHVILASQTLPENLVKIYSQIMNRVALQSTAASAQFILDSDNEAVRNLVNVDPGNGVFNDGGGNRDANHQFRVAFFDEEEQKELLMAIKAQQEICEEEGQFGELGFEKPRLLLSTIQDDLDNPLNRFVEAGDTSGRLEFGCPLYLGEEIAMENEFGIRLTSRKRQNLLILGADQKRASLLYGFSAMSILFNAYRRNGNKLPSRPVITFFDFGKVQKAGRRVVKGNLDLMNELSARFPQAIRVFSKDSLLDGIEILQREYQQNAGMAQNHYVIFAGLNRARRLLDNDSAYAMPPKKQFENLVKNGPENGYNYIVWANEPGSFCNFYGDLLSEFDYRLVYDLKEEEYETVIKSSAMDTAFNNNVLSYNPDEDNKKVRIYSMPLTGWVERFMARLERGGNPQPYHSDNYDTFGDDMYADSEFGAGEFGDEF